jgi:hypothetical protein
MLPEKKEIREGRVIARILQGQLLPALRGAPLSRAVSPAGRASGPFHPSMVQAFAIGCFRAVRVFWLKIASFIDSSACFILNFAVLRSL